MNLGQLAMLIRAAYLKDAISLNKIQGKPFFRHEILKRINDIMESTTNAH